MGADGLFPDDEPTFDGLIHVDRAVEILLNGNRPLPARLRDAMDEFAVATRIKEAWPAAELAEALEIDRLYYDAKGDPLEIAQRLERLLQAVEAQRQRCRDMEFHRDKYEEN